MFNETIFWFFTFLITYTYAVYPPLLLAISHIQRRSKKNHHSWDKLEKDIEKNDLWPQVAVVISAYNEEKHISKRINNLLALDYPRERLTIYIGSDGSSDRTVSQVREFTDERIKLFVFTTNRGKISVLNEIINEINEPVIVFSDANTRFQTDTVKKLVRHFVQDNVAGVCGKLNLLDNKTSSNKDSSYWRLEQTLKNHEGQINAFLGANGAIYAIRRQYYQSLPADTIIDDFTIFMKIELDGGKTLYDTEAIAEEEVAPDISGEYQRRVRIGTGNYQAFFRLLNAMHPRHRWRVFSYVSHKVIRWFTPHFMVLLLLINLLLLNQTFYQLTLLIQVTVYLMTFISIRYYRTKRLPSFIACPIFLVYMNTALAHGFVRYITGNNKGAWQRTQR